MQQQFAAPLDGLRASRCMHLYGRLHLAAMNRGRRRRRRSCSRRHGLANAAFAKTHLDLMLVEHPDQLHIGSMREVRMGCNLSCPRWPLGPEFLHEHHVVRVPHRDCDAAHAFVCESDFHLTANLGHAHRGTKLKMLAVVTYQVTVLQSRSSPYSYRCSVMLCTVPRGHATSAVAGDLRFRSIGIDQTNRQVGIGSGQYPFDAVGAYAIMAIADLPGERGDVRGSVLDPDDQEIIAASGSLYKRD